MTGTPSAGRDLWCDLGNTRLKWAQVDDQGAWVDLAPLPWSESGSSDWPQELDLQGATAWVVSVASGARRDALTERLRQSGAGRVVVHPTPPMELRIRHPETAGLDRLYAALGAWRRVGQRAAVVVDVGTAMTVDAVGPSETPGRPAFLGGAIAPGPELLARSLREGGAQLWRVQPRPDAHALGRETSEALAAGIVVGLQGAAQRLVRSIAAEAGWQAPPIVLTGGAASWVKAALAELGWPMVVDPHLVLAGLRLAAQQEQEPLA